MLEQGQVFGPSQQCFNAISFVITVTQDYAAVFANLTTLMERLSVVMGRLQGYIDSPNADVKLDKRLRQSVYEVLGHFLVIMGLAHAFTTSKEANSKLELI